ncbi:MAG: hypothetical protein DMF62_16030 [Acidobacteria bacterium]|nr:MAG: hypothetical protein DMF62_16030 [Acidobacteriota bacterium]
MANKLLQNAVGFAVIAGVAAIGFYLFFVREYEMPAHKEFSTKVKLLRKPVTGETRIVDAETGHRTWFSYYDGFGVTLENVEKLPNGEWRITLKDHN